MTEGIWVVIILGILQIVNTVVAGVMHKPHEKISKEILQEIRNGKESKL